MIDNLTVKSCQEYGIKCEDVDNVTIERSDIEYNKGAGIYCDDSKITIANNTISYNGQGLMFYDSMESGLDNDNWAATGLWHPVTNESVSPPSWNISHDGEWSWWFGLDEIGTYDTTVNYAHFSDNWDTSQTLNFNGTDYHIAHIPIYKEADVTSSSVHIEGDYLALADSNIMRINNLYNIEVTSDCIWTGNVGAVNLARGWNMGVNYSDVWNSNKTVQAAFSESLTSVNYTEVNQGPTNPTFNVGDDGDCEWSYVGEYTGSETINDSTTGGNFSQEVQDYIDTHSPDEWGFVDVPINVTSTTFGAIALSKLDIIGEYDHFNGTLTSKSINLTGLSSATLSFWSWFETDTRLMSEA
jgi:parallel beta-helix repeat protein